MTNEIKVGDTVRTTKQLYFVDGYDPATGEWGEFRFERGARLVVQSIEDGLYDCKTPIGTIVYLDVDAIESTD